MTASVVPVIPRDVLFGNPTYAEPSLSPDGTRLGYIAPDDGVLNVWVGPIDDPDACRPVTADRGRGIFVYGFCHDDATLFYLQDDDGDENWRLYLLDLATGGQECVTPWSGVRVDVLGHDRRHPTTMLLTANKDNPELFDVWRLDLTERNLVKVRDNPGNLARWLVDGDLRIRGGQALTEDGGSIDYLVDPDVFAASENGEHGELKPWRQVPAEDMAGTGMLGFSKDGRTLYYLSSVGVNASRLLAIDPATGEETVLAEDPAYDVGRFEMDPETGHPQAVVFAKDRDEWAFLDPKFEAAMGELHAALRGAGAPDGEVHVKREERTDRTWVVSVVPSDGPVHFYFYDRGAPTPERLRLLFVHRPELAGYRLAPMEPFMFTARDGLEVHGYLTFPVGVERTGLPAVVNVHGGPWYRDTWGFAPEAQWLANRGYVCVQVNFRGSLGYGKAFHNAGDKEWGRAMHTDLLDAVDHLVGRGVIDAGRVGIAGGSYGGYAALAGAAFTPEVFRCAVDLCGPSSLLTLLASVPPYWKPLRAMFTSKVGDPETEHDMLWERSPLSAVDSITIPVLVAQGANDPRVTEVEAEQIVAALTEKGLPHEYLLFPDEGHGLVRPENRMTYYAATERFLAEHIGGRMEGEAT